MKKKKFNIEVWLQSIAYKLKIYQTMISIAFKHLFGKTYYDREKNYYGYIGESKQLYCKHNKISRLTSTKFYCSDCGKTLHFVPEEVAIISELLSIFLVGSIVYLLTRKKD